MLKLFRKYTWKEWLLIVLILGLTVLQVYCLMTMTDFIQNIIKAITYVNYHNSPEAFLSPIDESAPGLELYNTYLSLGWDGVIAKVDSMGLVALKEQIDKIASASVNDIWLAALWMLLLALGYTAVQAIVGFLAAYVTASWSRRVRHEINHKVLSFSAHEIKRFSTPSLVTRVTNDVQQIDFACLLMMRMFFSTPITIVWAIVKIQSVSWDLMYVSAAGVVMMVIMLAILMIFLLPKFKIVQKQIDDVNGFARENLSGLRVVRAYNAEEYQEAKFAKANDALTKTQLFTSRLSALMNPVMIIILDGVSLGIYWLGAYLINKNTAGIDYASITSFMMLSTQIIFAFLMMLFGFIMWPRASVSAKRINEVLDTNVSIKEIEHPLEMVEKGTVVFDNVTFKYPDGNAPALEGISFEAKQGEMVAFIGATGSGKSSLINLVSRLYDVSDGKVIVNGVDVKEASLEELRNKVAMVPQKGVLFKGDVMSNLSLGNASLSEEEAKKALDIACASFVYEMEGGLHASIAQGGKNVSGGQKQRLCIARALASNPEIVIFDDSFSALDYKTDRQVRNNLKANLSGLTSLVVAQRIGTVMDADLIVVLDNGKMVGKGKHRELLENCPTYKAIALSQLSEEELGL